MTEDEMIGWHHRLDETWVWASSGSWWWTGKPGVLQSMGSQRVQHNWATELTWTDPWISSYLYFNASIFGLTAAEIDNRVQDIIDFSELGEFIEAPVRTYSSGMYMRLAFSVAINVDAEILLIDEILAVGDQHFQDKCFAKLEELKNSDKTIVIVSHSLESVKKLCNRAIWLNQGEVKMDGETYKVIEEYLKVCG